MKKSFLNHCLILAYIVIVILAMLSYTNHLNAQVKIGDNPSTININSMLEIESTNKGFLPPRITLNNVNAVAPLTAPITPGMLIYSSGGTVADGYYYWNGTKWKAVSASSARTNYVLVQSAADFPAPVNGLITLTAGTLYEINGTIVLSSKINLNGCVLMGADENNDKLIYTGSAELFTGLKGGHLRYLTVIASSGAVFNINGGGDAFASLIVTNCFFISSISLGTIQGMGGYVYFGDIGYYANTNGIILKDNEYVYLNNCVWDISNTNTFETFIGTFGEIQIFGGRHYVNAGATCVNITGITDVLKGSIKSTAFMGAGVYINGTFSKAWEVEAHGLNTEKDDVSTGNLYISTSVTTTFSATNTPTKILGTTTAVGLFRTTSPTNNRLVYTGTKTKRFAVVCTLSSISSSSNKNYSFYIVKNGTILPESKQFLKFASNVDRGPVGLSCQVQLAPNDYIEVWVANNTDTSSISVESMNLTIK